MAVIESVPNVSAAQPDAFLSALGAEIRRAGAALLDVHRDPSHNRSVFTFAGAAADVERSAHALVDAAIAAIDLRRHSGVHPRVGAVDVIPFVPLAGATLDDCVTLARRFAQVVSSRHDLPVFLYEAAASAPHRQRLEEIRRGGLSNLAERMQTADWRPDFGPDRPHPSAGVTVVGARVPLLAYNINLATDRLDIAQAIAREVRESSGGLPFVKALGLPLADRGIVQVSMNLTDYRQTPLRRVFDAVSEGARRRAVGVLESEIVGLVPAAAITDDDARYLRVRGFDGSQILETRLAAALRPRD